jgi:hypothetical protein
VLLLLAAGGGVQRHRSPVLFEGRRLGRGPLVLLLPLLLIILLLELLPRRLGLELILGGLDGRYHVHLFAVLSLLV